MKLLLPTISLFDELKIVLLGLENAYYSAPCKVLSGATVGQHTRHVIELFIELDKGYKNGVVNYEHRNRNLQIETDTAYALALIDDVLANLDKPNIDLQLEVDYDLAGDNSLRVNTNYYRELIYNIEHAVHHMALIRIGVNAISNIDLPTSFGVAVSTLKYRATCAQ